MSASDPPAKGKPQRPRFDWERAVVASGLDALVKFVLLVLGTHLNERGETRVGVTTLARECGRSENTVRKYLTQAREEGWIERPRRGHYRPGGDGPVASLYRITTPSQRVVEARLNPPLTE